MDPTAFRLAQQWNFTPTEELAGGHCSHVYANEAQVLKVPFQGEEMTSGYWAILNFASSFRPEIFASDPATGSLLMQRANPGKPLHEVGLSDGEQLAIWTQVVHDWQATTTEGFMSLDDFADQRDPLARHLTETTTTKVATHGDLHHFNILRHGDGWLCIDAKGVIGDPAFEGAAYVRNPLPSVGDLSTSEIEQRVRQAADALKVDPYRVWGWSVVMLRDGGEPESGAWKQVIDRLYECAPAFDAEQWI